MSKRIYVSVSTDLVGSKVSDILEFGDDISPEEIERECLDWMWDHIEFFHCPEEER